MVVHSLMVTAHHHRDHWRSQRRTGHDLDSVAQGYLSVLPHEVLGPSGGELISGDVSFVSVWVDWGSGQVVVLILSHLHPRELMCVALVNSFFATMVSDNFVWHAVFRRTWPLSRSFTSPWMLQDHSKGTDKARTASWKHVVRKRAETELNWGRGCCAVLREFNGTHYMTLMPPFDIFLLKTL